MHILEILRSMKRGQTFRKYEIAVTEMPVFTLVNNKVYVALRANNLAQNEFESEIC